VTVDNRSATGASDPAGESSRRAPDLFAAPFEALTLGAGFSTRGRTVTEADVVQFATLSGDFHPQHTDAEWAAQSAFGERIAHGMLVLAYAAGLVPFDPARVVALRRVRDAVFKRPVRLGDTIRVHGKLTELKAMGDAAGLVAVALDVRGAGGKTVMKATVEVLWATDHVASVDEELDALAAGVPL
jgi:3-hydroxybutyryl-CoA dehydratase